MKHGQVLSYPGWRAQCDYCGWVSLIHEEQVDAINTIGFHLHENHQEILDAADD